MKALITRTEDNKKVYTKHDIRDFVTIDGLLAFEKEVENELIVIVKKYAWLDYRMFDGITPDDFDFVIEIYDGYRE